MKKTNLEAPPRQRTSVPIQGLDLITPDDTVADGKCQILHNMRYEGGAWRPTHPYTTRLNATVEIIYNHNFDGEDHYIYYDGDSGCFVLSSLRQSIISLPKDTKISHFGKVLIFTTTNRSVYYFIYRGSSYQQYTITDVFPSVSSSITTQDQEGFIPFALEFDQNFTASFNTASASGYTYNFEGDGSWYQMSSDLYRSEDNKTLRNLLEILNDSKTTINSASDINVRLIWKFANTDKPDNYVYETFPSESGNSWRGEHAFFAALRMVDGTIINPTPIQVALSNNDFSDVTLIWDTFNFRTFNNAGFASSYINAIAVASKWMPLSDVVSATNFEDNPFRCIRETITVNVPATDTSISSVALFSTRVYQTLDFEKAKRAAYKTSSPISVIFSDVVLPDEPFYLISEQQLSGSSATMTVELTSDVVNNIEFGQVYQPLVSGIYSGNSVTYNERLHLFDTTKQYTEHPILNNSVSGGNGSTFVGIHAKVSEEDLFLWGSSQSGQSLKHKYILSYPDPFIQEFLFSVRYGSGATVNLSAAAKQSLGNGFSYFMRKSTTTNRYPSISLDSASLTQSPYSSNTEKSSISRSNHIQVSSANNCFNLPYENSYTVGSSSNKIIALNSPSIEMHEMKIGELPLYVFTEEGIFALQAGSDTLYASVVPINHDRIINPNTLAINNSIVYATERGIHMLRGSENVIISTPLHENGIVPIDEFKTCTFINPKAYNELVVLLSDGSGAYIYNLDSGYWSTRTLSGWKLNTDELVTRNSEYFTIYNLTNEVEDKCQTPQIITRPIKLGTLEYKRVETMTPRIQRTPTATFEFNCQLWDKWNDGKGNKLGEYTLNQSGIPIGIRRTGSSSQYFTFRFSSDGNTFNIASDFSISHIDFEWYERFRRRMR